MISLAQAKLVRIADKLHNVWESGLDKVVFPFSVKTVTLFRSRRLESRPLDFVPSRTELEEPHVCSAPSTWEHK